MRGSLNSLAPTFVSLGKCKFYIWELSYFVAALYTSGLGVHLFNITVLLLLLLQIILRTVLHYGKVIYVFTVGVCLYLTSIYLFP